jgi:ribonuclease HII
MKRAILSLPAVPSKILVDGIYKPDINFNIEAIIKGDSIIEEISAASIIAKVKRDKYMIEIDEKYPDYGFKNHKGYGTKLHFQKIQEFGTTDIHRMTFKGVAV